MTLGIGDVDRIGGDAAEHRDGAEHVGIGGIGLGVFAEIAAQSAHALALDPMTLIPACLSQRATGNQDMPVGSITAVMLLSGAAPTRNRVIRLPRLSDVSRKRIGLPCGFPSSRMRAT